MPEHAPLTALRPHIRGAQCRCPFQRDDRPELVAEPRRLADNRVRGRRGDTARKHRDFRAPDHFPASVVGKTRSEEAQSNAGREFCHRLHWSLPHTRGRPLLALGPPRLGASKYSLVAWGRADPEPGVLVDRLGPSAPRAARPLGSRHSSPPPRTTLPRQLSPPKASTAQKAERHLVAFRGGFFGLCPPNGGSWLNRPVRSGTRFALESVRADGRAVGSGFAALL